MSKRHRVRRLDGWGDESVLDEAPLLEIIVI